MTLLKILSCTVIGASLLIIPTAAQAQTQHYEESRASGSRIKTESKKKRKTMRKDLETAVIVEAEEILVEPPAKPAGVTKGGACTLTFFITEEGLVDEAETAFCVDPAIGAAMVAKSADWRYSPETRDGEAVRSRRRRKTFMFSPG